MSVEDAQIVLRFGLQMTEDELILFVPLKSLTSPTRDAMSSWLNDHEIDPAKIALGTPIVRDAVTGTLSWQELNPDDTITRRWRFSPIHHDHAWPARFPVPAPARRRPTVRAASPTVQT